VTAPIMPTYKRWPIEIVSGTGATVTDTTGRTYTDLVAGIAVASVGHSHPDVAAAISDQAARLVHVSNLYSTGPQTDLARRLSDLTGGMLAFFANSGAEAVECALKLARKWGGGARTGIVAAEGGFHGRTFGALAATGQPKKRAPFEPLPPGFAHVPYGDADALAGALTDDVVAVILEPIQGEAGVVVPPEGYLRRAEELCRERNALLILDEIQTGLGRTGTWLAAEHFGVRPDMVLLGKALAGGLPMSACMARPAVANAFEPGDHATTFGGGPVTSAAALAVLEIIERDGLLDRSKSLGEHARARLAAALPSTDVRGRGLMIGVDLGAPRAYAVAEACLEKGVLVNNATESVVRLVPPLVITEDELDAGLDVVEEVIGGEAGTP
jgi:acetylornithine/N-succinyldiaminopimelate aminotransferase